MLEAGHRVVVTWVVERERDAAREAFGESVDLRRVDVTSAGEVGALAADLAASGAPWAVAHLVGGYRDGDPFAELDLEAWRRQFELNAWSLAMVLRGVPGGDGRRAAGGGWWPCRAARPCGRSPAPARTRPARRR